MLHTVILIAMRAHTMNKSVRVAVLNSSVEILKNSTRLTRTHAKFTAGNRQCRWHEAFLVFESTGKTIILFSRRGDSEARRFNPNSQ